MTGAQILRYHVTDNPSQGKVIYLSPEIVRLTNDRKLVIAKNRIVLQRITGVDSKIRIIATLIPAGVFCANSTNYISPIKNFYNLYVLLGILNSKLINFYFKQTSTNTNVTGKELSRLLIQTCSNLEESVIENYVKRLLLETSDEIKIKYEVTIDNIVYHLYGLTYDEVLVIDPETPITREKYDSYE